MAHVISNKKTTKKKDKLPVSRTELAAVCKRLNLQHFTRDQTCKQLTEISLVDG